MQRPQVLPAWASTAVCQLLSASWRAGTVRVAAEVASSFGDSATLQASEADAATPGIIAAIIAMATPLNRELHERLGFDPADVAEAAPNARLGAVRADDDGALDAASALLDARLAAKATHAAHAAQGVAVPPAPRTVTSAPHTTGSLTLISLPGEYAVVRRWTQFRQEFP